MPQALIVFNPCAGRRPERRRQRLAQLLNALNHLGWHCDVTEAHPESIASTDHDAWIVCGGDGTLHEMAQIIASIQARGAEAPLLGVAPPLGTANVLAHALGCPAQPETAAQWLQRGWEQGGQRRLLGAADAAGGRRYFLAIASVGYDAAIVAGVAEDFKRQWGKWAFAARAAMSWRGYFPAPFTIAAGGMPPDVSPLRDADGLFFSLTRYYAGRFRLGAPAPGQPLVLATRDAPRLLPLQALALGSVGLVHAPGVEQLAAAEISVPTPGRPLQLDGEAAGVTPVHLGLDVHGIRFLAPL